MRMQQIIDHEPYLELSDAEAAQLVLSGDTKIFEVLVRRYSTPLFTYIYHFTHDSEEASDVLQEVFIRFYNALPTLGYEKPFKPWLFQVAHNYCIDQLRQKRKKAFNFSQIESENDGDEGFFLEEMPDPSPSIEEVIERQDMRRLLQQMILSLPIKFRNVVMLRYTSNLRFVDIGNILGMPEQTTKTYFHRAKVLLRKRLKEYAALQES